VRYLSPAWLEEAAALVAADAALAAAARDLDVVVDYLVEGGPDGDIAYHLALGGGVAALGAGPGVGSTASIRCDHATALAVATGALGAQRAFMDGLLRIGGDVQEIVAALPALAGLPDVLAPLRPGPDGTVTATGG
jgi:hypothetical protein